MIRPIASGQDGKGRARGCPTGIPFFILNRRLHHITKPVCEPPIVMSPFLSCR